MIEKVKPVEKTQDKDKAAKRKENKTTRSPSCKLQKSLEIRKNHTDRDDSRYKMKRNMSRKEERTAMTQQRIKHSQDENQYGVLKSN